MQGRWDLGMQHIEEIVLSPLCSNGYHSVAAHVDNYPGAEAIGVRYCIGSVGRTSAVKPHIEANRHDPRSNLARGTNP